MRLECRECFPHHRLQRKPLVSDPGMHHDTCVTHVPWCISGSLTHSGGENVPGIPGACATRNFTYLVRGPYGHIPTVILYDDVTTWKRFSCEWSFVRGNYMFSMDLAGSPHLEPVISNACHGAEYHWCKPARYDIDVIFTAIVGYFYYVVHFSWVPRADCLQFIVL